MDYFAHVGVVFLTYTILAISLNLLLGYTGLMSMAHAAFFGVGAYASALVVLRLGVNFFVGMMAGVFFAAAMGAIISIPALRVKGEYLIIVTLGFQMVIYGLMVTLDDLTRGIAGLPNIARPEIFGWKPQTPVSYLPLVIAITALSFVAIWRLTHSPFGRVLKAMREDEEVAVSFGKNLLRFKVVVFMLAGAIAAVAGSLFASYTTYINPNFFPADVSITIIAIVALGGMANLWGSVVGAFLLITIPEILMFMGGDYELVHSIRAGTYGALLVILMIFRPQGIVPEYATIRWGKTPTYTPPSPEERDQMLSKNRDSRHSGRSRGDKDTPIEVKKLCKSFGGIKAVDDFTLDLPSHQITALVGANGAGKTTAFNLITRFLTPDEGKTYFRDQDITRFPPHRIARLGVVRSFQGARVFNGMTLLDNVLVARPEQSGENLWSLFFQPWRVAKEEKENHQYAMACLSFVGLSEKAQELAGEVSYAEQKMLQIACLLSMEPQVLLLDEPVSGVDPIWIDHILELLHKLVSYGKTICIIEHNLDVVKNLAGFAYFLDQGKVVAAGAPSTLMADRKLLELYFGV